MLPVHTVLVPDDTLFDPASTCGCHYDKLIAIDPKVSYGIRGVWSTCSLHRHMNSHPASIFTN